MATHSSILACETPWTEEPGGLQSLGSQRLRHDLVTKQQQQEVLGSGDVSCHPPGAHRLLGEEDEYINQ